MVVRRRSFDPSQDFVGISSFLTPLYRPNNADGNWFQAIWEYAYTHPYFDEKSLDRIGIWEDRDNIVGVATFESRLGEAFFNIHPNYQHLKLRMLKYAEKNLASQEKDGGHYLKAYINDFDTVFECFAVGLGYEKYPQSHRPISQFVIPAPFPTINLPEGYHLSTLAEDNDLRKMNRVLWRGFNHPGEPPEEDLEGRRKMQSGPNYRKDLAVVVVAPSGDFVSFCGMWYDKHNCFGYVEPVATDPDYRRRGLGRAAVLEGIRLCSTLGATVAYVGSDNPFYLSFGFRKLFTLNCWRRMVNK
jgi:GNAT superfamily N-acetyltransferase